NAGAQQTTTRIGQFPTQVVVQTITENVTVVSNSPLAESVPIVCVGPSTIRIEESGQSSGAQGNGIVVEELNTTGHDTGDDPSIGLQLALYVPAEIIAPISAGNSSALFLTAAANNLCLKLAEELGVNGLLCSRLQAYLHLFLF
ncbi:hypothetical protein IFM89_002037, partial [Coptis chinensis]